MKLESFFIICKPTFQVSNKTLECLFDLFSNNLDDSRNQNYFCSFFTNKGSVYFLHYCTTLMKNKILIWVSLDSFPSRLFTFLISETRFFQPKELFLGTFGTVRFF